MFQLETRRGFLATLIKGGAALTLPYQLFAQERISSTKIADNFTQVTGAGGNILVISGPDGLLLVDGAAPERSADLMKFIGDQFKNQRIQALFNTDWHPEHTGSNEAIRKTGAKIIAHENTKLWLGGDFYLNGGPRGLGILMGFSGIGALLGAVTLAGRAGVRGLGTWVMRACGGFGVSLVLFSLSRTFWLSET